MFNIIWLQAIHGAWKNYRKKMNKQITPIAIDCYPELEPDLGKKIDEIAESAFIAGFSAGAHHANIFMTGRHNYGLKLN